MYQQINMYQPIFRRQRKVLSSSTLLKIILLAAALLIGLYIRAHLTVLGLQSTFEDLAQSYEQLNTQITIAQSRQATPDSLNNIADISQLESQVRERMALLRRIESLSAQATSDFGDVFEVLAKHNLAGLWLTAVSLNQDGSTELRGTALDATLVPRYLQLMAPQQPRLTALSNGFINIKRHASDKNEIDFIISYAANGEQP